MKGDFKMKTKKDIFKCNYFTVEELAGGVYAAFATEEGGAMSNSGIIDLGERTVVFDTFMSADAAQELRKFAEEATGRGVSYVINSHSHFDHIHGNCVFDKDTPIIAAQKIYNELKIHENDIGDMKKDAPQIISSLKEKLQGEADELSRKLIEKDIRYFEMIERESFSLRLPDITFEGNLELVGTCRKAILPGYLSGHTDSDIILYLPEEKIAFMGDLLFTGIHPWLGAGDPEGWVNTIHELKKYGADILVPGHGITGSIHELSLIEEYIKAIAAVSTEINEGSLKLEEINAKILPEPFADWKGNKLLPNVKYCCEYIRKHKGRNKL